MVLVVSLESYKVIFQLWEKEAWVKVPVVAVGSKRDLVRWQCEFCVCVWWIISLQCLSLSLPVDPAMMITTAAPVTASIYSSVVNIISHTRSHIPFLCRLISFWKRLPFLVAFFIQDVRCLLWEFPNYYSVRNAYCPVWTCANFLRKKVFFL